MKKIIVTGGLGFIGSNLIINLLKKNYKVLNLDKKSYASNIYNVKEFQKNNNYKFHDFEHVKKMKYLRDPHQNLKFFSDFY